MPLYERVSADIPVTIKTASYTIAPDDNCVEMQFESASSVSAYLPSVSAVSNGFNVIIRNVGAGTLTIDPSGSETIDGNSTEALSNGDWRWIRNDGSAWKSISTSAASGGIISAGKLQSFVFDIINDSGTLKHVFLAATSAHYDVPSATLIDRINSAHTGSVTPTPTGTDATTPFAGGAKVSTTYPYIVFFDTIDQSPVGDTVGLASLSHNSTGTNLTVRSFMISANIDGVTVPRWGLSFANATSGVPFNINTSNLANGTRLIAACYLYIK